MAVLPCAFIRYQVLAMSTMQYMPDTEAVGLKSLVGAPCHRQPQALEKLLP